MQWIISKLSGGKNKWSKWKILAEILGFPTSVENMIGGGMGGSSKFDEWGGGLTQYMEGAWGDCQKISAKEFI